MTVTTASPAPQAAKSLTTARLAYDLWIRRQGTKDTKKKADDDWGEAERQLNDPWLMARVGPGATPDEILWQLWARIHVRPYLAIEAGADPEALAAGLQKKQTDLKLGHRDTVCLAAVLDGSPEASRDAYRLRYGISAPAGNVAKDAKIDHKKDDLFYTLCFPTFSIYRGVMMDQGPCSLENRSALKPREYQDGCAVAFATKNALHDAITAAARLRRVFTTHNVDQNLLWAEQLHVRVSIGSSWEQAVRYLAQASRDEIFIAPESLAKLDPTYRQLCIAAGVKPGCRNNATSSQELTNAALSRQLPAILRGVPGGNPVGLPEANTVAGSNGH